MTNDHTPEARMGRPVTPAVRTYTIHVTLGPDPVNPLSAVLDGIASRLPNVQDRGDSTVAFRTASDGDALRIAKDATRHIQGWVSLSLTTGYGVHRRAIVNR